MKTSWLDLFIAAIIAAMVSIPVRAVDTIADARALYTAAEYENALAALDQLQQSSDRTSDERRTIAQYRAYCLLALGRAADAEEAIAVVVTTTPLYTPAEADVSPRVRTAFRDVRRRMLPAIIQARYAEGKSRFEQKDFAAAATIFNEVVATIDDPDAAPHFKQAPLSDLRSLAMGFRDLSASAAVPAPLPARPAVAAVPAPAAAPVVNTQKVYGPGDLNILPPVVIRQLVPPFPLNVPIANQGVLDVLIDENGRVESVTLREPVSPAYDKTLLEAARHWSYKPATVLGVPVKYRKMMLVAVKR